MATSMSRNRMRLDEPLGEKYDQAENRGDVEHFLSVARKIGFSQLEIDKMKKLYKSKLEEAKNEHWTSS